jgi:hypothetical protein
MTQPPGRLTVSSANPRYFTAAAVPGKAVYRISIRAPSETAGPAVVHLRRIPS